MLPSIMCTFITALGASSGSQVQIPESEYPALNTIPELEYLVEYPALNIIPESEYPALNTIPELEYPALTINQSQNILL